MKVLILFQPQTLEQALSQIAAIDQLLGAVRVAWLDSKATRDGKREARDRLCLDNLLDSRLRYMAHRDAFAAMPRAGVAPFSPDITEGRG
jgi:hypothetical protein